MKSRICLAVAIVALSGQPSALFAQGEADPELERELLRQQNAPQTRPAQPTAMQRAVTADCLCARVCSQLRGSGLDRAERRQLKQALGSCPHIHDELVYEAYGRCDCTPFGGVNPGQPRPSPNH